MTDPTNTPHADLADGEPGVWVRTVPGLDGAYRPVLEVNDDHAVILTGDLGLRWVGAVVAAVAVAEYETAVTRQMVKVTGALENAWRIVKDLRADRPPIPWPTEVPIRLDPGVAPRDGYQPFLALMGARSQPIGQWSPDDARGHVLAVLEALAVADLDSAYRRTLIGVVGVDPARAAAVIDDLAQHR